MPFNSVKIIFFTVILHLHFEEVIIYGKSKFILEKEIFMVENKTKQCVNYKSEEENDLAKLKVRFDLVKSEFDFEEQRMDKIQSKTNYIFSAFVVFVAMVLTKISELSFDFDNITLLAFLRFILIVIICAVTFCNICHVYKIFQPQEYENIDWDFISNDSDGSILDAYEYIIGSISKSVKNNRNLNSEKVKNYERILLLTSIAMCCTIVLMIIFNM